MNLSQRKANPIAIIVLVVYTLLVLSPLVWMVITSFKVPHETGEKIPGFIPDFVGADQHHVPEKYHFTATLANYMAILKDPKVAGYILNSVIIAGCTTIASVLMGSLAAYGFSRFRIAGSNDMQFFILSTRMLPAMAVSVPILWMYSRIGLDDTHLGLVLLYTCFNLSFSTWMMKAFIDEIPTAYEEAAMLDGYSRVQILFKIIFPQAMTGIMATAVFCLIAAWNEYAFALTLTNTNAKTMPIQIASVASENEIVHGRVAAGAVLFMLPIAIFTILMRKHLLRGVTFGAVKG